LTPSWTRYMARCVPQHRTIRQDWTGLQCPLPLRARDRQFGIRTIADTHAGRQAGRQAHTHARTHARTLRTAKQEQSKKMRLEKTPQRQQSCLRRLSVCQRVHDVKRSRWGHSPSPDPNKSTEEFVVATSCTVLLVLGATAPSQTHTA